MATCPDACESGACQHACRFCDETICKYNDPCLTRALEWIEKLERALDALEKLRAPVSPRRQ